MTSLRRLTVSLSLALALAFAIASPAFGAGGGRSAKRVTSSAEYVQLETLSAPVAAGYGFQGILLVDCGLDIPDAKLRARVNAMIPRIRDALRTAVADYTYLHYRNGAPPNAEVLTRKMQESTDKVLGQSGAQLLLASMMIQPGS